MLTTPVISPRASAIFALALERNKETMSEFIRRFHKEHNGVGARNHLFKVLGGTAICGEIALLPLICKSLGIDYEATKMAVRADKAEHKGLFKPTHNKVIMEIAAKLEVLSPEVQWEVLGYVNAKYDVRSTHHSARASAPGLVRSAALPGD